MNVIDWGSSKMKVPSDSPLSGESEAALMGYGKIKMLRFLIHEFTGLEIPAKLLTDSKSLMQAVNSNNSISDKRCAVAIAMIRRVQQADKIQVGWLKGTSQPADVLTKATANPKLLIDILTLFWSIWCKIDILFICGMVFSLNQSNPTRLVLSGWMLGYNYG